MQIYIGSSLIYDFNRQRTFRVKYIARNSRTNQKHRRHDKRSMSQENLLITKG